MFPTRQKQQPAKKQSPPKSSLPPAAIRERRAKAVTDSTKTDGIQASSSSSDPIPASSSDAFAAQPKGTTTKKTAVPRITTAGSKVGKVTSQS